MVADATQPQSLFTLRKTSLFNGLQSVGVIAVLGLILWAIGFNSHVPGGFGGLQMLVMGVPMMAFIEVCRFQFDTRSLQIDS